MVGNVSVVLSAPWAISGVFWSRFDSDLSQAVRDVVLFERRWYRGVFWDGFDRRRGRVPS